MFTARVQGHGLVDWSPERVDAYATTLLSTHQPARGWIPRRRTSCRDGGQEWPCVWATWAELWGTRPRQGPSATRRPAVNMARLVAVASLPALWIGCLIIARRRSRRQGAR